MPRKICLSAGLVTLLLVGLLASGCGGSSKKAATTASTSAGDNDDTYSRQHGRGGGSLRDRVEGHADRRRRRDLCAERVHRHDGKTVEGMDPDLAKALAGVWA